MTKIMDMKTDLTKQIKMTSRLTMQRFVAEYFTAVFHSFIGRLC